MSSIPANKPQESQTYWQRAQGCMQKTLSACSDRVPDIFKKSVSGIPRGLVVGAGSAVAGTAASAMSPVLVAVVLSGVVLYMRPRTDAAYDFPSYEARDEAAKNPFSPVSILEKQTETSVGAATTVTALAAAAHIHPTVALLSPFAGHFVGKFINSNIKNISDTYMYNIVGESSFSAAGSTLGFFVAGIPGAFVGGAAAGYFDAIMRNRPDPDDNYTGED